MTTTTRERPIILTPAELAAALAGTLGVIERAVKDVIPWATEWFHDQVAGKWMPDGPSPTGNGSAAGHWRPCPFGEPGTVLRVKEPFWLPYGPITNTMRREGADTWPAVIYGDDEADWCRDQKWGRLHAVNMPRHLCRLHLENLAVSVVRVDGEWRWRVEVRRADGEGRGAT